MGVFNAVGLLVCSMLFLWQVGCCNLFAGSQCLSVCVLPKLRMQVSAERARLSALSSDLAAEAAHAADERRRVDELQSQKAELEGALADAHARLEALAAGYGVSDALAEQERLREAVRLRDADVARLTEQAALQLDSYDMLEEIARRLAREVGHAPPAGAGVAGDLLDVWSLYPDTAELRRAIQSTVDRVRAANSELSRQNDALEEQRARLLKQLRVHAENMGDKSLRYYGELGPHDPS